MNILYRSILLFDWFLGKLFYVPIEIVWFFVDHWFTLVQWAEEEFSDTKNSI